MKRLPADRRGGVGMLVALGMPVLIGMAAFAVDLGAVQLDTRRLQGMADAAAIAAASGDAADAQRAAEAMVADAHFPYPVTTRVTTGNYSADATVAPGARFAASPTGGGAARVVLESTSPTFLAAIFGQHAVAIARTATAARQRYAAFSIGSRLLSFDGGLLNTYLSALTGSSVSLSVMDYNALAGADVDLLSYLPLLRTKAGLEAGTYDEILKSNVSTPQALDALAGALTADGKADAAKAVNDLLKLVAGRSLSLSALIDAGPFARQTEGGAGIAKVDSLALVTAILQLASQQRQVSLDLGATVPGLAATRVSLAIGEREANSPWITITDTGTPIVRTAQTRLYVRTRIGLISLPLIGSLVSSDLPLFIEIAGAEGRLGAIDCSGTTASGVTLEARTDVARAAIGTIDESKLGDFNTAITPTRATLAHTLLVDVFGSADISMGASEPWQSLNFDAAAIAAGNRKTVRATSPIGGLATSLISHVTLTASPLPISLDLITQTVGAVLKPLAGPLDGLLMSLTGLLGVGIGEADLRVTGVRCGSAALVG